MITGWVVIAILIIVGGACAITSQIIDFKKWKIKHNDD